MVKSVKSVTVKKPFCKNSEPLIAANYFRKDAPLVHDILRVFEYSMDIRRRVEMRKMVVCLDPIRKELLESLTDRELCMGSAISENKYWFNHTRLNYFLHDQCHCHHLEGYI